MSGDAVLLAAKVSVGVAAGVFLLAAVFAGASSVLLDSARPLGLRVIAALVVGCLASIAGGALSAGANH